MSIPFEESAPDKAAERRRVLLAVGPQLRDVEAAVRCYCSCHPRPAAGDHHEGGARCACQLTPEERRRAFDELRGLFDELGLPEAHEEEVADLEAAAAELGVDDARLRVSVCPMVVTGTVDGYAFYYRERHDRYRVEVPVGDAGVDLYDHPSHPSHMLVDAAGYMTPAQALTLSVSAVRDHQRRVSCSHLDARAFCPDCGTATP